MIDTITLSINIRDPITPVSFDPSRAHEWTPSIGHIIEGGRSRLYGRGCLPHYRPPLPDEERSRLYFPKVKLLEHVKRGSGIQQELYITFSAPKLVFRNNFNELESRQLKWVCSHLAFRLKRMGIKITPKVLEKATVVEIHYSKNIILTAHPIGEAFALFRRIKKPPTYNLDYKDYSYSCGQSFSLYQENYAVCFYDKKRESRKHRKFNHPLYADAWETPKSTEVLRMEVRCLSPTIIKQKLGLLGFAIPDPPTLESLFKSEIAQAVLLHEFKTLRSYLPPITLTGSLADILHTISLYNPELTPAETLNAAAMIKLQNELGNETAIKKALGISSSTTWCNRKRLVNSLKLPSTKTSNILDEIERQLTKFTPITYFKKGAP